MLESIARFLAELGEWLVVEFIPKDDPQTQQLLASREDIFADYSRSKFEEVFRTRYQIEGVEPVKGLKRSLYLMSRL